MCRIHVRDTSGKRELRRHGKVMRDTIKNVAEKMVGRSRKREQRRATRWWNEEVKRAVRRKKELYNRALGEKSQRTWEDKRASKEPKRVVREVKEEDCLRCGK